MRLQRLPKLLALTALLVCAGPMACGGGGSASDAGPPDAPLSCESFATEQEEILNAPTNAAVIRKTPAHPPVGDAGLP